MNFKTLTGQDALRRSLTRLVAADRLSHAVLLTGPAGSGKQSWGRALARAVLCREPAGGDACLKCISCRQFGSGNHPDYFFVEPDGRNIKIDQVRSLRPAFHLLGGKKVCLIRQAEAMTAEASSSLLKVLEEPPEGLYFILLAEQAQLLFETILSRCQHYHLQPLSRTEIQGLLMEAKGLSSEKAAMLARLSRGMPGRAYELAEDEQFDSRFEEAETLALSLLSGPDSAYHLLSKAAELAEREDLLPFLDLLCFSLRDCLVMHYCSNDHLLIDPGRPALRQGETAAGGLENIIGLINNTVHELTATNVNRRLLLEKMLILMQRRFAACRK